ncbi:imm11 family protein [Chitinimonas sp. BJB300]|uniref:imm11 family protein n=1 Tax=Chitinimonas sp. BJB300 TaxID=1559339 RepID=UPI000C0D7ABB|nr:DUF1629 domain-containing protein [Chitinimonas sp. BJB300]PHV09951.1 hypothetical protein CSQ89_18850 [Chitinimonas sp. BJB300]TSJ82864.1 hypothetical protein FG002_021940 [Chitinimonas sp. BJB300]
MVYLWKIPDEYTENLIGEYDRTSSPDRFIFKKGEVLSSNLTMPVIKFDVSTEELLELDDLANNAMIPVVSERLATVLTEFAPDDIQLIDVAIKTKNGELRGYKVLNVINKVTGIDKEQSRFTLVPGSDQIMSFRYLKYKSDCLKGNQLARDAEYSSNLIVSESLASRLIGINLKGVGLYLPENIDW